MEKKKAEFMLKTKKGKRQIPQKEKFLFWGIIFIQLT